MVCYASPSDVISLPLLARLCFATERGPHHPDRMNMINVVVVEPPIKTRRPIALGEKSQWPESVQSENSRIPGPFAFSNEYTRLAVHACAGIIPARHRPSLAALLASMLCARV